MEANTAVLDNFDVMDTLIEQRHLLGTRQRCGLHADHFLHNKLAGDEDAVYAFLDYVRRVTMSQYREDLALISGTKTQIKGGRA
mmetsp:Transcript_22113/g.44743  ORF Transcript_22113/g.44743 Transcript_22113/m.44743 type:complete len:84 (-) Transcript_22113:379-630(-)